MTAPTLLFRFPRCPNPPGVFVSCHVPPCTRSDVSLIDMAEDNHNKYFTIIEIIWKIFAPLIIAALKTLMERILG